MVFPLIKNGLYLSVIDCWVMLWSCCRCERYGRHLIYQWEMLLVPNSGNTCQVETEHELHIWENYPEDTLCIVNRTWTYTIGEGSAQCSVVEIWWVRPKIRYWWKPAKLQAWRCISHSWPPLRWGWGCFQE